MPRYNKGYTIIELMITLLVLGIVLNTGVNITKKIEKINLLTTSKQIQTIIRQAQECAYKEEGIYMLAFYPRGNACYQIRNTMVINQVEMPKNITMNPTSFPDDKLYFRKKLAPSRGGSIILRSKAYEVKITVLPVSGRVKIYPLTKR